MKGYIQIIVKDCSSLRTVYVCACCFPSLSVMCLFLSFVVSFHLTTLHSFLFSQGQINIVIDVDLFCSYYVIILLLRNNTAIAYFVVRDAVVVIYIYIYAHILFYGCYSFVVIVVILFFTSSSIISLLK